MKRKQVAAICSLFSLAVLAGCGETTDTSSSGSNSSQTSTSTSTSSSSSSSSTSSSSSSSSSSFDASQTIVPYTRDTTSGTRDGFMTTIGLSSAKEDNGPLKSTAQEVASNDAMISSLKADTYGIGYFSYDSVSSATSDGSLKILNYEGVTASEESILDGTYGLSRNFNYCIADDATLGTTKATIVHAFVAYMGTQEGLAIIANNGGTVEVTASTPTWDSIKDNYAGISDDHSSITINFGGSTSVEKISKALSSSFSALAGNFVANHNHTGSGAAVTGITGGTLDIGFASREFNESEVSQMSAAQYGLICVDGIVVAVSSSNPLTDITKQNCYDIYAAESTNVNVWSDIIG